MKYIWPFQLAIASKWRDVHHTPLRLCGRDHLKFYLVHLGQLLQVICGTSAHGFDLQKVITHRGFGLEPQNLKEKSDSRKDATYLFSYKILGGLLFRLTDRIYVG